MRDGTPTEEEARQCFARLQHMTCEQLKQWLAQGKACTIVDVRTEPEWRGRRIPGAKLYPVQELLGSLAEVLALPGPLMVHCEHGMRSLDAAVYLTWQGRSDVFNVREGLCAWSGPTEHGPPAAKGR